MRRMYYRSAVRTGHSYAKILIPGRNPPNDPSPHLPIARRNPPTLPTTSRDRTIDLHQQRVDPSARLYRITFTKSPRDPPAHRTPVAPQPPDRGTAAPATPVVGTFATRNDRTRPYRAPDARSWTTAEIRRRRRAGSASTGTTTARRPRAYPHHRSQRPIPTMTTR